MKTGVNKILCPSQALGIEDWESWELNFEKYGVKLEKKRETNDAEVHYDFWSLIHHLQI